MDIRGTKFMAISTSPSVIMSQMMNFPHLVVIGAALGYIVKLWQDRSSGGGGMDMGM